MTATELLRRHHREVSRLFRDALKSEDGDEQTDLAMTIVEKLTAHAILEEEIFYPAFRSANETMKGEDQVLESGEEHRIMKFLVDQISRTDFTDETFHAKLTVLKEFVELHVEDEEAGMFLAAEKLLGRDELNRLADELKAREAELQGVGDDESPD